MVAFRARLILLDNKGIRHSRRGFRKLFFLIKNHREEFLPSDGTKATRSDKGRIERREPNINNHMTEESSWKRRIRSGAGWKDSSRLEGEAIGKSTRKTGEPDHVGWRRMVAATAS